jgi:putative copper export protein
MSGMLDGVTGWSLFAGLALTTGAVATRWLILSRLELGDKGDGDRLRAEVAGLGAAGAVLLVAGLGLFFVRQLVEFRDPFSPWRAEASLLLGTRWGATWMQAGIASLLVLGTFAFARRRPVGWWMTTPIVLGLGAFPALTGHASAADRFATLFVLADTLHVWAAGAWSGGLATGLWLEAGARRTAPGTRLLPALVPAFSPVAMAAVATLIATGGLASWAHLPSVGAAFTSSWGRLLLIKLGVVVVVLALGARNFRVLTPRLHTSDGDAAMRRSALLELAVAQIVLIVTALLVRRA